MKSTGTIEDATGLWYAPNIDATNSSGFTGLPGGDRFPEGDFRYLGQLTVWWSSTRDNSINTIAYGLDRMSPGIGNGNFGPKYGFSVRCVRD